MPRSSSRVSIGPSIASAALATPALHRLNRTEYANAIRDLLALDVNVNTLLPADGSSEGFDNLAEALAVSPSLIQGYVSAAMKISRLAVGDRTLAPSQTTFAPPAGLAQDRHIDGLPLGTRGGVVYRHTFPLDAEYEFSMRRARRRTLAVDLTLDGAQVKVDNPRGFRLKVPAGPHTIGLARRRSPARRRRGRDLLGLPHQCDVHDARRRPDAGRHGTVQRDGRRRHAEPARDLRLQARDSG